jgi:hypothetical protein
MNPNEFVATLLAIFGKRHASEQDEAIWLELNLKTIRGTDPAVLKRAAELIIEEREERVFPLPAEIRKAISRSVALVYPDRRIDPPAEPIAPPSEIERQRVEELVSQALKNIAAKALPEPELPPANDMHVDRNRFEAMQKKSRNHHLHGGLTPLSKRITGEATE